MMAKKEKKKPICKILDTNIWRQTLLLNSVAGSALLYGVDNCHAIICLPKIVKMEIEKKILKVVEDSKKNIERAFGELKLIFGKHRPYELPLTEEVGGTIRKRFQELGSLIHIKDHSKDNLDNALNRVVDKKPPNSNDKEQYRDSLIWETALEMGEKYEVHFVTEDKDFRENDGLHSVLKDECNSLGVTLIFHRNLSSCLEALKSAVKKPNEKEMAQAIFMDLYNKLSKDAARFNLSVDSVKQSKIKAYITKKPQESFLSFEVVLNAIDVGGLLVEKKNEPFVVVRGSATYLSVKKKAISTNIDEIEFCWKDDLGQEVQRRSIHILAGTAYLGKQPDVVHMVRADLDEYYL